MRFLQKNPQKRGSGLSSSDTPQNNRLSSHKPLPKREGKMKLRSYKMTHDTGFAPNICGNTLSLATCKPKIRQVCDIGEWIAGFSSQKVNGKEVAEKRLIYLARVSDKINFAEFWHYFEHKRPNRVENGDNIYKPSDKVYEQMPNAHHGEFCKEHDLSVDSVLLCDEFYYFGVGNALDLGNLLAKINVPSKRAPRGRITEDIEIADTDDKGAVQELIDFVYSHKNECERFKDENGKVGGRIIIHQGGGACGLSNVPNASKSGSCGSTNISKASSCGNSNATKTTKSSCGGSHTSKC